MELTERLRWSTNAAATPARAAAADIPALVREYSPLLFRVANSIVRSPAEAEDIVQDTFVRVLEHAGKLADVIDMRVWLVRIAWRLALDRSRRTRPQQLDELFARSLTARDLPADQVLAESRRMHAVLAEIDRLPAKEREVLLLSAMEELSTASIAEILGRSESATRALLHRARTRLKQRLVKGDHA